MKQKITQKNESSKEPFDIRKWLKEKPKPEEIKGDVGAQYIPIGIIENLLDVIGNWSTTDFKFSIIKVDKFWFADASVVLEVEFSDSLSPFALYRKVAGAVTYQITSQDENQDHSATALSLATANAAKKLGLRFGRALNGRLDIGEKMPVIQEEKMPVDVVVERTKLALRDCKTLTELKEYHMLAHQHASKEIRVVYEEMFNKLNKN